jgi:23S rRNA pseudouridine1911/1915/1917 synthase
MIASGLVRVNGEIVRRASYRVRTGTQVAFDIPPVSQTVRVSPPKVLHETYDLLVIDKPPGLIVHPTASGGYAGETLADYLRTIGIDTGDSLRPGIVHRLDKDTSGILLVAKTSAMHAYLTNLFRERKITKEYSVLVHGSFRDGKKSFVSSLVGRMSGRRKLQAGLGREALTEYKALRALDGYTLLQIKLHTGRTHQIRVHMEALGHPVAGDRIYCPKHLRDKDEKLGIPRQFIHASRMTFRLPDNTVLDIESPLPEDLQNILKILNPKS